jgi:hypothetical protein
MTKKMRTNPDSPPSSTGGQSDKFKETARELESDEDEARWEERLKKIADKKPDDQK